MGYSASETCAGGAYTTVAAPFLKIGGALKLGDLVPEKAGTKAVTAANFNIQFLDAEGNTATVADDENLMALIPEDEKEDFLSDFGEESVSFSYVSASKSWFLYADRTSKGYPMNDYPIPFGSGLLLNTVNNFTDGAKIVFSGEVCQENTESPVCAGGDYIVTGNVAPKGFTLGDFEVIKAASKAVTAANFNVQFLDDEGNTATVKNDPLLMALIPEDEKEDFLSDFGDESVSFSWVSASSSWFLYADRTSKGYPMNDYPISGGKGFLLNTVNNFTDGAKLILPSALTKPVED